MCSSCMPLCLHVYCWKDEAIQQLQSLGIEVFEPSAEENGLNWDSLVRVCPLKRVSLVLVLTALVTRLLVGWV
jgi:hypothetical protein